MTLIEAALTCPQCVLSVMGDHAGEDADAIFTRKKNDITRTGKTFWLMRSPKARPAQVQGICKTIPAYTIFVESATKGGARPTTDVSGTLDLWNYGEFSDIQKPLKFILGCSTVCAVRNDTKAHLEKMKSRYRGIVAVARLADPYCVWIR